MSISDDYRMSAGVAVAVFGGLGWIYLQLVSWFPAIARVGEILERAFYLSLIVAIVIALIGGVLFILYRFSFPHKATKLMKTMPIKDKDGRQPKLRRIWKSGSVWTLAWKVQPLLTASTLERNKEVFEQALSANCKFHAEGGLVYLRAGTSQLPKLVKFDSFYKEPVPAGELVLGLGKSREGAFYRDLKKALHLLINGSTGCGKSVLIRQALTSLVLRKSPEELRLVLVDLKRTELPVFRGLPHLLPEIGVVTELDECEGALLRVNAELTRRTKLFASVDVEGIDEWHAAFPDKRLPYLLLVIDELAEMWRMPTDGSERTVSAKTLAGYLARICQQGRAAGIHTILCTQHSNKEAVPGGSKGQLPESITGRCSNADESYIAMGSTAAHVLPPQEGLMIWKKDREVTLQVPYISKSEARQRLKAAYPSIAEAKPKEADEIEEIVNREPKPAERSLVAAVPEKEKR